MDEIMKDLYKLILNSYAGTNISSSKLEYNEETVVIKITHPSKRIEDKEQVYAEYKFWFGPNKDFSRSIRHNRYDVKEYLRLTL